MRPTGVKGEQVRRTDFCSTRTPLALKTLELSAASSFLILIVTVFIPFNSQLCTPIKFLIELYCRGLFFTSYLPSKF